MKKIIQYVCEVCGRQFKTAEKAQACEWEHKKNLRIVGKSYGEDDAYGFPEFITVDSEEPSLSAIYRYEQLTDESFYRCSQ